MVVCFCDSQQNIDTEIFRSVFCIDYILLYNGYSSGAVQVRWEDCWCPRQLRTWYQYWGIYRLPGLPWRGASVAMEAGFVVSIAPHSQQENPRSMHHILRPPIVWSQRWVFAICCNTWTKLHLAKRLFWTCEQILSVISEWPSFSNINIIQHLVGKEYTWCSAVFYFGYLAWSWPTSYLIVRLPLGKYLAVSV